MPLQLNHTNPANGVPHPESYWAIHQATIYPGLQLTEFVIGGWHSAAARSAGKEPFATKVYSFNQIPAGSATFGSVVANLYAYVQANPDESGVLFFAGATTVP